MPYDSAKTRQMLTIVGAFANLPGGDYISDLAKQLTDAEAEITVAVNAKLKAEGEANRYASELATMQSTMRQLREENEALKQSVAPAPKKVRAPDTVPALPPPQPAPTAPAKRTRKLKTETPAP